MSPSTAPPHYLADRKEKLLRNLGGLFTLARRILPAYVKVSKVSAILDDTRERFGELLAELPNLGRDRNRFNSSIAAGVAALADRGLPIEELPEYINRRVTS